MNNVFQTKWNAAIGAWVACSELVRNRRQSRKALALLVCSRQHRSPFVCARDMRNYTNDVINSAYTCARHRKRGHMERIGQPDGAELTAEEPEEHVCHVIRCGNRFSSSRKTYTTAGVGITTGGWDSAPR